VVVAAVVVAAVVVAAAVVVVAPVVVVVVVAVVAAVVVAAVVVLVAAPPPQADRSTATATSANASRLMWLSFFSTPGPATAAVEGWNPCRVAALVPSFAVTLSLGVARGLGPTDWYWN
jgi:hypothetical protein